MRWQRGSLGGGGKDAPEKSHKIKLTRDIIAKKSLLVCGEKRKGEDGKG